MSSISIILTIGMVIVFTIIGIIIVRKEKKKAKERRSVFSISLLFVFTFLLIFFSLPFESFLFDWGHVHFDHVYYDQFGTCPFRDVHFVIFQFYPAGS